MQNEQGSAGGVFDTALRNKRDVSNTFFSDFGWEADEGKKMLSFDREARRVFRVRMGEVNGGIRMIADVASAQMMQATALLDAGSVAAVDGTNAMGKIDYMNTTKYACAVGWITSRQRGKPTIVVTRTASSYADDAALQPLADKTLAELEIALDAARDNQSWPTTFREYQERETALEACGTEFVFIDGPVVTQNLVTQAAGRNLYERMFRSGKTFIGVIKNVSGSTSITRWAASSLEPGEMWVVGPVGDAIATRAERGGMMEMGDWIRQSLPKAYVRVVYRPRQKAFAFECHMASLEIACALLLADASKTLNHEMPMLIETVDSQVRAGFNGSEARDINLNRMAQQCSNDDYMQDYRDQLDVVDEREWR